MASDILKSKKAEYRLQLPITGKRVNYTTFTLGSELILMQAAESGDISHIMQAIINLLDDCIRTEGVNAEDLPQCEAEMLLYNCRAKSSGKNIEIMVKDPDDPDREYPGILNLEDVKVHTPEEFEDKIELSDGRIVHMSVPSMKTQLAIADLQNFDPEDKEAATQANLLTIVKCLKGFEIDGEGYSASDFDESDLLDFVRDLDRHDGMRLFSFAGNLPYMKADVKITRPDGTKFSTEVRDLASFL